MELVGRHVADPLQHFGVNTAIHRMRRKSIDFNGYQNTRQSASRQEDRCDETMWFLVGRLPGEESSQRIPVHVSPFRVGRRSEVPLSLQCNTVSSMHAELTDTGNALLLRDLDSTNGTFVNGKRIHGVIELQPDDFVQFASIAFRVLRQSIIENMGTVSEDVFHQAVALVHFDKLMSECAVVPHYQPIMVLADRSQLGYEVLARSTVPGLETPSSMFYAATQLDLQTKLSQMVRQKAIDQTSGLEFPPHLFLNTHPSEIADHALLDAMESIRTQSPHQTITLEIPEAAANESAAMINLCSSLKSLGIGLAFDDFGAGQARLVELSDVQPDYLKFDISFIRKIHHASEERLQMVGALVDIAKELGIATLAVGIECAKEYQTCLNLGFEFAQGYYLGRPIPLSPSDCSA